MGSSRTVSAPAADTLATVVVGALEQGKRDLAALRLYDYDHGDRAWTMAAGLPVYVSLFGRDTLTAAWQAAMASSDMMPGTLAELATSIATGSMSTRRDPSRALAIRAGRTPTTPSSTKMDREPRRPSRHAKSRRSSMSRSCTCRSCSGGLTRKMKPVACTTRRLNSRNGSTRRSGWTTLDLSQWALMWTSVRSGQ